MQKQFDKLNAVEKPTEEQLQQLEAVESELLDVTAQLDVTFAEDELLKKYSLSKDEVPTDYEVPNGEEVYVHVAMRQGSKFNPETGKQESQVRIQKFNPKDFKNFVGNVGRLGIKFTILHKPQ